MGHYECSLQRQMEIEECLLEMMHQTPYEDITVKDLTEKLHIARKTFYHYFSSKHLCLEALTDRLIMECDLSELQDLPKNASSYQICEYRLVYWIRHKDFLDAIIANGMSGFLLSRFLLHFQRENRMQDILLRKDMKNCDEDILFFYLSGQVSLMLKWCREGFALPREEMIRKCIRLICEAPVKENDT